MTCDECEYWEEMIDGEPTRAGICRRYPPSSAERGDTFFPSTFPSDWCGEFQLRGSRPRVARFVVLDDDKEGER